MTEEQRDMIEADQLSESDFIFNSSAQQCQVWNGTVWLDVGTGVGGTVVTGAYTGDGRDAGQRIDVGGPVQDVKIMLTRSIPTPGYLNYAEKYDVWYDADKQVQYWIDFRTIEGHGITCTPYAYDGKTSGMYFYADGFGVVGSGTYLNAKDSKYTYFAVLSDGRDKKNEYHVPDVSKK